MKVIVVGFSTIGVTSGCTLACKGYDVTAGDPLNGMARKTIFANADEISPSISVAWSAPGMPLKALGWLPRGNEPLIIKPRLDPQLMRWIRRFLGDCTAGRCAADEEHMIALGVYCRDTLQSVRDRLGIDYDQRMLGTLQLFRRCEQTKGADWTAGSPTSSGIATEHSTRKGASTARPRTPATAGRSPPICDCPVTRREPVTSLRKASKKPLAYLAAVSVSA